ncbi:MAG: PBP1A family penicillin-binding protein [Syntrophaceae bacterium]|nr:PBP1A family penicillin-binding protein [Syntrophaceae bacterium]
MIRRYSFYIISSLAVILLCHIGYLYFNVSKGTTKNSGEGPSIFYGRPTHIRKGTHLENIRFAERLRGLSYRKVTGKPAYAGSYSEEKLHIRIFLSNKGMEKLSGKKGPVDIVVRNGRVDSIISSSGKQLNSINLEPEEIGRIVGPKMESQQPVPLTEISTYLQNAVIASEDARFYSHIGIDLIEMVRALFANSENQQFSQSISTITQQMARNFFLSPEKTFLRKLREVELALILELRYTKKQILEMYLNKIYWGQDGFQGIYGVEGAADFYFSKHAKNLSLEEAALLAGIIHSPNRYRNIKAARERRNAVLARMQYLGMIEENQFHKSSNQPMRIRLCKAPEHKSYFIDYIQRITKNELGSEKLYYKGYRYYTTMDPVLQAIAQQAVKEGIEEIEKTALPAGEQLQAALVAVDPLTGEMTVMVGGRDYKQSTFNRAIDANRQPGSAFKPFVLLTALSLSLQDKKDFTLSSIISGAPVSMNTPEGVWSPANFKNKKYGNITIRQTIEDSVNTATTRLAGKIGFKKVLKTARLAGITSSLSAIPSLALGSFEVTPLELTYAYTTIASGGIRFEPFPLYSVTTANGDIIMVKKINKKRVFDPRVTYLAGHTMEGVLARGTAREAKTLGINFPASGKTGTTNNNRDSWFVGYTPDVVCAVWVGYDSGADTGLTGAKGALHIWSRFMRSFYSRYQPLAVIPPKGIQMAVIDQKSGYLATSSCPQTIREAYLRGTAPKKTCPDHPEKPTVKKNRKKKSGISEFFSDLFN